MIDRAHQADEFLMDNTDDLLFGAEGFQNLFADGLAGDRLYELLHNVVGHVRLKQCRADLLHAFADVGFGDLSGTPESTEGFTQTL
jgi:hypothetical protein